MSLLKNIIRKYKLEESGGSIIDFNNMVLPYNRKILVIERSLETLRQNFRKDSEFSELVQKISGKAPLVLFDGIEKSLNKINDEVGGLDKYVQRAMEDSKKE